MDKLTQSPRRYLFYISQNYSYAILRPLQTAILKQGGEICWFLEGDEVNPDYLHTDEQRLMTIDAIKQWKPDAVFVPGNVVPAFIPGIKVEVFHGLNSGKVNRKGREYHFEIRHCFDLYCTQGPSTTQPFIELARKFGTFTVTETGWPVLDPLFKEIPNNTYTNPDDTRPVVLFCSTFSPRLTCAPMVFDEIQRLSKQGNWRWLIQFHPKMDRKIVEKYKNHQNENLQFIETDDVVPLLKSADVMLCDTSSVLQMFLLQNKPVVTINNSAPAEHLINIHNIEEIESALALAISRPQELIKNIKAYCEQVHPYRDGLSSERVLAATDALIDQGIGKLKRKPLNLLRHLKMRRKLGYWKL